MPHSTTTTDARTTVIDGQEIAITPLETIDYGRLAANDAAETEKLLHASQMPGFFYLDLQNESSQEMLPKLREVYAAAGQYFEQPSEVKMKEAGQDGGYKPDEHEGAFHLSHDKMAQGTLVLPPALEKHAKLLERFAALCHEANQTMLSRLSDGLQLEGENRFERRHRADQPSDCALSIISAPSKRKRSDWGDTTHTDGGSLTLLFTDHWGIMMEDPESKEWTFVEPRPGCALINVADALQELSGGKLHSCRHAVTQAVDGVVKRYYVVSFLRPEKAV